MKRISIFLAIAIVASVSIHCGNKAEGNTADSTGLSGHITMSGAFALYPMAIRWSEEFMKLHPNVKFDIQGGGAGKGMTDVVSGTVSLGMVSRDINPEEESKGAYGIAVTKDAVIPTVSSNNPYLNEIYQKGVTKQQLTDIWVTGKITTWGQLLGNGATEKIEVFKRSDASGAGETFSKYLGGQKEEELTVGIGVFGDPGLAETVRKSKFAVGFNNINFTYDSGTRKPNEGIAPFPLDLNENGTLDPNENFYSGLDELNKAINDNVFPSPPARQLYLVSKGKPTDPLVNAFLHWVLTDGQKFCAEAGYIPLSSDLVKSEQGKLSAPQ